MKLALTQKDLDRFWSNVVIDCACDCWVWIGAIHPTGGYGRFSLGRVWHYAHRIAYAAWRELPDPELTLDHLCRIRRCVNPWHMEQVTRGENVLRGESRAARQARQTHCHKGHPLEGENLEIEIGPTGRMQRRCRECRRRRVARAASTA